MNRFSLPNLGIGLGLRTVHYAHILEHAPAVDWFEILSENYMQTKGRPLDFLDRVAERYPIVMHGVSLSIGGTDPLDRVYLAELKALRDRTKALWVSDHLCWTGVAGKNTHDLLPMPYTEESLRHVAARVRQVQDVLGAPLTIENPSTYVEHVSSTMTEWDFLAALATEADCALLLDVNNVYVSAYNHGFDAATYLAAIPFDRVVQLHVSGHTNHGTHIVDSHIGPVIDPVWELLGEAYRRGEASVLLEWDAEIPSFEETHADALRAKDFIAKAAPVSAPQKLRDIQLWMVAAITGGAVDAESSDVERFVTPGPRLSAQGRFEVYRSGYHARLGECLLDDYPVLAAMLGEDRFAALCRAYVDRHPSASPNLNGFGRHMAAFCREAELEGLSGGAGFAAMRAFAADLAALEWALVEVLHAEVAPPLELSTLQGMPPEAWAAARFTRSEAVRLLRFDYPVNAVFIANRESAEVPAMPGPCPTAVAVYRKDVSLWRMDLTPAMMRVLEPLFAGRSLGEALEAIEADEADAEALAQTGANLMAWFREWVTSGFFTRVDLRSALEDVS